MDNKQEPKGKKVHTDMQQHAIKVAQAKARDRQANVNTFAKNAQKIKQHGINVAQSKARDRQTKANEVAKNIKQQNIRAIKNAKAKK